MDAIRDKFYSLTVHHAVLVTICTLFIYILRVKNQLIMEAAWHIGTGANSQTDQACVGQCGRVRPVVTDVDGDGQMEVILIASNNELIVAHYSEAPQSKQLPQLRVLHSVTLPAEQNEDGSMSRPVALEAGYLDPYEPDGRRSQYIVVILDHWTVLCYNYTLHLQWQQTMMDVGQIGEKFAVKSVGILIAPVDIQKDDRGMVTVGASFGHKDHNVRGKHFTQHGGTKHDSPQDDVTFTHFSTFALSGSNGSLRWHHQPGDYEDKTKKVAAHHWKLELKTGSHHVGESHWTKYTAAILNNMPHQWDGLRDTTFDLADIKQADNPPSNVNTPLVDILGPPENHIAGYFYGGIQPHSKHEHVAHPNAVVIHTDRGIEVLRLHNGQPLTRLELERKKASYADIDEDGSLEEVYVTYTADTCQAHASTISPRPRAVFSVPACQSLGLLSGGFINTHQVELDDHLQVPPLLVKSIAHQRGFVNHLLGRSLHSERRGYDSVFVTSTGRVTSYSPGGELNWQSVTGAQWADRTQTAPMKNTKSSRNADQDFTPSSVPMAIKVFGKETVAVISGWDTIALVDLQDGHILAQHSLPCQPSDKPITADFTTDGFTDVIVTCPQGYLGFTLISRPSYIYMTLISVTVVLSVLLLSWCCQPDTHSDDPM